LALHRAADELACRDHVRYALSRYAGRNRVLLAPDRLVPRRLARRLFLRRLRVLQPRLVAWSAAWPDCGYRALADPGAAGRAPGADGGVTMRCELAALAVLALATTSAPAGDA